MTFIQLKYFIEVAHCLNFTNAADRLYISVPSLSKYISSFESELGYKLFERKNRGVELTPEGRVLLNSVESSFYSLMVSYDRAVSQSRRKIKYITCGVTNNEYVPENVMKVFQAFNQKNSKVQVLLKTSSMYKLPLDLINGNVDFIINSGIGIEDSAKIESHPLHRTSLCMAVNKNHPLADRTEVAMEDFKDELFILVLPKTEHVIIDIATNAHNFTPNCMYVDDAQTALLNVANGIGVSMIPSNALFLYKEYIKFIPMRVDNTPTRYHVAWMKEQRDPNVLELVDQIWKTSLEDGVNS